MKKICPKCGSTDVHPDWSNHAVWAVGGTAAWICHSCSRSAPTFPETDDPEAFRKQINK